MLKSMSRNRQTDFDYSDYIYSKKNSNDYLFSDTILLYTVIKPPAFGKLQFKFENFLQDIAGSNSYMNTFTQNDIDQGTLIIKHTKAQRLLVVN